VEPETMPSSKEAIQATINELRKQMKYLKEHRNEQLFVGKAIDTSIRLAGQLCVINLIRFGKYVSYSQVHRGLKRRNTTVSSDMIGKYAKATKTPKIKMLSALYDLSEEKTKTVWKARQDRTPLEGYRTKK
jgi:hypothetical protein